jgi:hypothetical protein
MNELWAGLPLGGPAFFFFTGCKLALTFLFWGLLYAIFSRFLDVLQKEIDP